jgi:hypothetical protein
MPTVSKRKPQRPRITSREKVRTHRAKLRAQGLRPIQIWVPDTTAPKFASEARRQSHLIAASSHAADDQAFIDSVSVIKFE